VQAHDLTEPLNGKVGAIGNFGPADETLEQSNTRREQNVFAIEVLVCTGE
jgi:hypothetical protein